MARRARVKSWSFIFRRMVRLNKVSVRWWVMKDVWEGQTTFTVVRRNWTESINAKGLEGRLLYTSPFSPPFLASASIGHKRIVWPQWSQLYSLYHLSPYHGTASGERGAFMTVAVCNDPAPQVLVTHQILHERWKMLLHSKHRIHDFVRKKPEAEVGTHGQRPRLRPLV